MPRKLNIVEHSRKRVFDRHFKIDEAVLSYDRLDGRGRFERRRWLIFERGDSAAVLLHDLDADRILLTEQLRAPTIEKGPGVIREILAGSIEDGETPASCIVREVEEEIGYRIRRRDLRRISTFYVSPGGTSERIVLFYAPVRNAQRLDPTASGVASEGESIRLVAVPRTRFLEDARAGRLLDAKTLIAGLWLAVEPPPKSHRTSPTKTKPKRSSGPVGKRAADKPRRGR